MVDNPRCLHNEKWVCKECPECFQGIAWGTWHKAGQACKCDGLCYEGRTDGFTWDESARGEDYADPWAGAGPANLRRNLMPMPVTGHPSVKPEIVYLGGATMSPRIERLQNNRLASNHLGPGNPRMENLHSNRRLGFPRFPHNPRIPGQSSQTGHVGMIRPRMGIANPNIKPNRMINMHSRKMNPNLDDNSVMMPSGQEAELTGCFGCVGSLIVAAAGMSKY